MLAFIPEVLDPITYTSFILLDRRDLLDCLALMNTFACYTCRIGELIKLSASVERYIFQL